MVYSIQKGGRGRGVPRAVVVQYYCNSAGITGGGGQYNEAWLVHKSVEVNEHIVKANMLSHAQVHQPSKKKANVGWIYFYLLCCFTCRCISCLRRR